VAARRPLNWNVLVVYGKNTELVAQQLAASDRAARAGGRVVALTLPDSIRLRLNFRTGFLLDSLPGWDAPMALPDGDKIALLSDPQARRRLDEQAQSQGGPMRSMANWAAYEIVDVHDPANRVLVGRTVGELSRERGTSPWDTLIDIVVDDGLRTVITLPDKGQDDASWEARVRAWRDPRTVVGASDAGAHLDMIDSFAFATTLLEQAVRRRRLLPLEEAVQHLTSAPAALYGLVDRGVVREGARADLVLFDADLVGVGPVRMAYDLPGAGARLHRDALGIEGVFVAGEEIVHRGEPTGVLPGHVLRRGIDTRTPALG
jgi:N-acyl-D-aspartate/D-glutamate deacylase